jgi:intracellular septation protein
MTENNSPKKGQGVLNFALDFGPLLVFFLGYRFGASDSDPTRGPLFGTALFMVAITIAVIVSKWKLGRVAPMLWISALLVVGLGGVALWLHDPKFIQIKPTVVYLVFATLLLGGLVRGKALLKYVLEHAYDGLTDLGWRKLSLNWGLFFVVMAALNEIMRAYLSFDTWITLKVWGMMALTFLFAMANIPMLMRHGLSLGNEKPESDAGDL